jgi:uncharacterized protein (DUF1501 family)
MRPTRRREFLRWSAASLTALGLGGTPPFLRRTFAAPTASGKKLLFIFLRGGIDAVQAVIPYGDQGNVGTGVKTYLEARPTLGVPISLAHDLNGFASLHSAAQSDDSEDSPQLANIFHGMVDERGPQLAVLHRIGYESQSRSHFSSQQFWENGVPGAVNLEAGVFNNYLSAYPDPEAALRAATLGKNQAVLLKGAMLTPVLRSVDEFALPANVALGSVPTEANPAGLALKGLYGQTGFNAEIPYEALTYSTGASLLDNLQFFEDTVRSTSYAPEPDAQPYYAAIADRGFAESVMNSARLLKQVSDVEITGCNQGGYDTHGGEDTRFPILMRDLSLALTALYHDLRPLWEDTLVMTLSEFGRTSAENGNFGTDHGEATAMFMMGGSVIGGVYNCDPSTWENGDLFSTPNGRYVSHRTDFRAVYHEVITRHLGDPEERIDSIIPGYTELSGADPAGYLNPLGFLA